MGQKNPILLPGRIRQYVQAFKDVNREAFKVLQLYLREELGSLTTEQRGCNGAFLFDGDPASWVMDGGSVLFMKPTQRFDPEHHDGGASLIHAGITLWGRRMLHCSYQGDVIGTGGQDSVLSPAHASEPRRLVIQCAPGDMYISGVTGYLHCVEHQQSDASQDLLALPGMGDVEVAVMLRCGCFKHGFGTATKTPPKPLLVFSAASKAVLRWLKVVSLRQPALDDCRRQVLP